MFYRDNQSEKMNNWHILLLFRQIKIIICKIPDLGGQFVCSFKSNLKGFELFETFWVTPKRTCLSVIGFSVVGQLRWKEYIKKHKKFLIFLIDNLDFIFLCKIRNNDRTIEYII